MKSKQSFLFLCCLLLTTLIYAQSSSIKGRISVYDSKNDDGDIEYVEDAIITSPYSKSVKSDYKGRFSIQLNNHQKGDSPKLLIRKDGYEVINQMDIDNAEVNNKYTLRIFIAPDGKMDEIRRNLLRNASNYVLDQKEQLLASITSDGLKKRAAISNLEKRTGQKINNVVEGEEAIIKMNNYLEEQLPDNMFSLAAINPDFTSKMFKSAFAYYEAGKIDKAIEAVDENKLNKAIKNVNKVIKDAKNDSSKEYRMITLRTKTLNQIRDSYILKIIALQQSFQFAEANNTLQRLDNLSKILPSNNDSKIIEQLRIPPLSTMSYERNAQVLSDKKQMKKEERTYGSKESIFNEKENAIAAEKNITSLSQLKEEDNTIGENKIFSEDNPKTLADAKVDDFENTLFIPEETGEQIITILNKEKNVGAGHTSKEPIMVSRGKVNPPPAPTHSPPPAPANVQRTPIVTSPPEPHPVEIDRNSYIAVDEIIPIKKVTKARSYSSQIVTKRTSLRKLPTASSKVLKRLAVGTKVKVIERVDKYWYRVTLNGREGFVKSFLLEK